VPPCKRVLIQQLHSCRRLEICSFGCGVWPLRALRRHQQVASRHVSKHEILVGMYPVRLNDRGVGSVGGMGRPPSSDSGPRECSISAGLQPAIWFNGGQIFAAFAAKMT